MLIHIILGILKIIGILLLILLCLVLLLVLSMLLVPLRYKAYGIRDSERYEAYVRVSWFLHIVHVTGKVTSGAGFKLSIRLFGIPLEKVFEKVQSFQKKRKDRTVKKQDKKPELEAAQLPEKEVEKTAPEDKVDTVKAKPEPEADSLDISGKSPREAVGLKKKRENKIRSFFQKLISIPGRIRKAISNFRLTAKRICDKIKEVRELLSSDAFLGAKTLVLGELKGIMGHVLPRKVKGTISFGLDEPYYTGQILAALSIFYPLYGRQLTLQPYFDRNILEGEIVVAGRMYGVVFLRTAIRLLMNKDIKTLRKNMGF